MKPRDGHILEVSKNQANQWIKAMELSRRRVLDQAADDLFGEAVERVEVEIHFFLVALLRFYRSLVLALSTLPTNPQLESRVTKFHEYLGIKRTMRNVGEHFDDYLVGRGRDRSIETGSLHVWSLELSHENARFDWLDETFDLKRTMEESTKVWSIFLEHYHATVDQPPAQQ